MEVATRTKILDRTFCFQIKITPITPLEKLGEFELISLLTKGGTLEQKSSVKGIGDDAAVLSFKDKNTVVSTDLLAESIHFNLSYMGLKHLGYKAIVVNLSDIYAMNAHATQVTVSIAVSNRFGVESLEELYAGIHLACKTYGVDLVGGDTTSSQSGLLISVTAIGQVDPERQTLRSGGKPNDLLVVSGDLGGAYLGFLILERERQVFEENPHVQPDLSQYSYLIERQIKPEARKDMVALLEKLAVCPTSMIDISDGLSSEALHLCKSSGLGCHIYENKIPIDPCTINTAEELSLHPNTAALNGGEDYELLFSIDQKDYPKIKGNPNLTVIGHFTEKNAQPSLISQSNEQIELIAKGWNTLKNNDTS